MRSTNDLRCLELESTSHMLMARERSLQQMAQSAHCKLRVEAEKELGRVRAELTATYVSLRQFQRYGEVFPA